MKRGQEQSVFEFLANVKGQLFVPIYQRDYSWTENNREYFYNFIESIDLDDEYCKHYIHSILTKEHGSGYMGDKLQEISIIDGQQRLITSNLFFCAVCAFCKNNNVDFDWENKIYNEVLIHKGNSGDDRYKLCLKDKDNETYRMIVDDLPMDLSIKAGTPAIINTYNFFLSKFTKANVKEQFYKFCRFVMGNDVAELNDNPQILFETINFSGTPLKEFEIVRSYTLLKYRKSEQEKLFYKYWVPMTSKLNKKQMEKLLFSFHMYVNKSVYLRTKGVEIIKEYEREGLTPRDYLKDLYSFFEKYCMVQENNLGVEEISESIHMLNAISSAYVTHIIIMLYDCYMENRISLEEFVKCIKLLEVYAVKFKIDDSSSAMVRLRTCVSSISFDDGNCFELLENSFKKYEISDNIFKNKLLTVEFYKNYSIKFVKTFYECLENYFYSKGKVSLEGYTIEHIMPQKLTKEWEGELGKDYELIHSTFVDSIGNLTLVAYNSNLSNKSFKEKLEMENGFCDDRLHLNKSVCSYNHWNEDSIRQRAELLSEIACNVWAYPTFNRDSSKVHQAVLVESK